ncbi:Aminopeptidase N [Sesbania bispinosa]|nr:Aminopeptidase N [Sesbania bispinosa]
MPTLEDVIVLLKLHVFGDVDLSTIVLDNHIVVMAKALKAATVVNARHSRERLAHGRSQRRRDVVTSSAVMARVRNAKALMAPFPRPQTKEVAKGVYEI